MSLIFGTVLPWLLVAVGTWLGYQLVRQNGRILLRLESIEKRFGAPPAESRREPAGLPLGTAAPEFELPDLAGQKHKLSEFRGNDVLLIFFNPKCGFCTRMAADLAALPIDGANGRAVPVVITTGNAEANRRLVEQHGIRCTVLLQEQMEVASQYRAQGTPMGYRIGAEGKIASDIAVGAERLLALAAAPFSRVPAGRAHGATSEHKQPDPSLARSRLEHMTSPLSVNLPLTTDNGPFTTHFERSQP